MNGKNPSWMAGIACAAMLGMTNTAHADLYAATAALDKQDYSRAFELSRELAELGRLEAQENLAIAYVNGQGVKRDNVLGYAWATLARENGGGEEMQRIIDQLAPYVTPEARERLAELQARFGKQALEARLLPAKHPDGIPAAASAPGCAFGRPANPDDFGGRGTHMAGTVFVEFTVMPDGRARNPRTWIGVPAGAFDEAARAVVLNSTYKPKLENGKAVPCEMRIYVRFGSPPARVGGAMSEVRAKARSGDPRSQVLYGLALTSDLDNPADGETALDFFVRAAQAGLPAAQYLTGVYMTGGSESAELAKGRLWLEKAASGGSPDAQVMLATILLESTADAAAGAKAIEWLEIAVAKGSRIGRYYLAALLAAHPEASRRDPQRALTLLDEVMEEVDVDPAALEIRAAAEAMLSDFHNAVKDQKQALSKAKKLGWDFAPQQARLEAYTAQRTWTGALLVF